MNKKPKLTCDDLEKFLSNFQPVSIAYKLLFDGKSPHNKEKYALIMQCSVVGLNLNQYPHGLFCIENEAKK